MYGFCPAKATWESDTVNLFRQLVICAETGVMMEPGGMNDQPDWWINTLSWFLPLYSNVQFITRARMIFGDGKKPGVK